MSENNIRQASLADIRQMKDSGKLDTKLPARPAEDFDPAFWKNAEVRVPQPCAPMLHGNAGAPPL
jgi:hypothetical protein